MLGILRNPRETWKWIGPHEVDLTERPVAVRQVPSRSDVVAMGFLCATLVLVPAFAGYMSVFTGETSLTETLVYLVPLVLIGLGLIPVLVLAWRSGRTVGFGRDTVSVEERWFGRRRAWTADYGAFAGVEWFETQSWTGRTTRHYYVVRLRHRDPEKAILLYCAAPIFSTVDETELARRAKDYATQLGVPLIGRTRR